MIWKIENRKKKKSFKFSLAYAIFIVASELFIANTLTQHTTVPSEIFHEAQLYQPQLSYQLCEMHTMKWLFRMKLNHCYYVAYEWKIF